ncbi:MAG: hypothetical protein A2Z72_05810 [Omnitrophica bacterium RBG_13_46_9]|nr:MAG: hypothetical protein A2Z72_05810 [Omnitrophica bacterium RBG_13_46_9]
MHEVTLQINLSQGDIPYARLTVPALVGAHRANVDEKIAVVDCCRPQKTQIIDPDRRFPEPEFNIRVKQICTIAEELKKEGYLDRIIYLWPDDPLLKTISRKFMRNIIKETHDCWGIALMQYIVALESCATRYIIHYDGDMLLYQASGYDWSVEAKRLMEKEPLAVAGSPRSSPPFGSEKEELEALKKCEVPIAPTEGGWLVSWFGTRCILLDLYKFNRYLPLLKGRYVIEVLTRKYLKRSYPPSFELLMFYRIGGCGGRRITLGSRKAWTLHPPYKSDGFLKLLPRILQTVRRGDVPEAQRGRENINLSDWKNFLQDS